MGPTEGVLKFENTITVSSITIRKTVSGNMGDVNKTFKFTVTLDQGFGSVPAGATTDGNTLTFYLKHGESITIEDVPIGSKVTIQEESGVYTAAAELNDEELTNWEFTVADNEPDQVDVNNTYNVTVDTGIDLDALPFALFLLIPAMAALLLMRKRKMQED